MNREIKFRGEDIETGIYVHGSLLNFEPLPVIHGRIISEDAYDYDQWEVNPETVGEFTGLKDQHQEEIYEGKNSVSLTIIGLGEGIADVVMKDGMWQVYEPSQGYAPLFELLKNTSIIIKAL